MEGRINSLVRHEIRDETSSNHSDISQSQTSDTSLPIRAANHNTEDAKKVSSFFEGDINTAAALRAQYAIQIPKQTRRRHKKTTTQVIDEDTNELVIDSTASLPLHSKKTERLQRKQQKRTEKLAYQQSITTTLFSLPGEILIDTFTYLQPPDIVALHLTSQYLHTFISAHESSIARNLIRRHYWTIQRCFPLPMPLAAVPSDAHAALLSPKRQEMLAIHRKSYQHIHNIDPHDFCTCLTCIFAWNNLCLIVDLHHWQHHLENREPLPIIPRGATPTWNLDLLRRNADMVRQAVKRPLVYARILQLHLLTITGTIARNSRWRRKLTSPTTSSTLPGHRPVAIGAGSLAAAVTSFPTASKPRLYHLTDQDVQQGTDQFLERAGPPSYDFPYMRDNYYSLEAYLPNRKWSNETQSWHYYALPPLPHERDLEWVRNQAWKAAWKGNAAEEQKGCTVGTRT